MYTPCRDTEMVMKFTSLIPFKFGNNIVYNVFIAVYKILNKYK